METPPNIYQPFFPLVPLYASYPTWAHFCIKGSQRRRREHTVGMKIPLIAVVSGKLAAIRAFPPAQAAVREQEFGQPDPAVASGLYGGSAGSKKLRASTLSLRRNSYSTP